MNSHNDTGKPAGYIIQPAGFSVIDGQKFPSISGQDETAVTLYLKHTSVAKVTEILNDMGFRAKSPSGSRKLTTNDISYVIQEENIQDTDLCNLVRDIFKNAKKFIDAMWN